MKRQLTIPEFFKPKTLEQSSGEVPAVSSQPSNESNVEGSVSGPPSVDDDDDPETAATGNIIAANTKSTQERVIHQLTLQQFDFLSKLSFSPNKCIEMTHKGEGALLYFKVYPNLRKSIKIELVSKRNSKTIPTFGQVFILDRNGEKAFCLQGDETVDDKEYHRLHFNKEYKAKHSSVKRLLLNDELKIGADCVYYEAKDTATTIKADLVEQISAVPKRVTSTFNFLKPKCAFQFEVHQFAAKLSDNCSGYRYNFALSEIEHPGDHPIEFQINLRPSKGYLAAIVQLLDNNNQIYDNFQYILWFRFHLKDEANQTSNSQSNWEMFTNSQRRKVIDKFIQFEMIPEKSTIICQLINLPKQIIQNEFGQEMSKREMNQCLKNYDAILSAMEHANATVISPTESEIILKHTGSRSNDMLNSFSTNYQSQTAIGGQILDKVTLLLSAMAQNSMPFRKSINYNFDTCIINLGTSTYNGPINFKKEEITTETMVNLENSLQNMLCRVNQCLTFFEQSKAEHEERCNQLLQLNSNFANLKVSTKKEYLISPGKITIDAEHNVNFVITIKELHQNLSFDINVCLPIYRPLDPRRPVLTAGKKSEEDLEVFLSPVRQIQNASDLTLVPDVELTHNWARLFAFASLPTVKSHMPASDLTLLMERASRINMKHDAYAREKPEESEPRKRHKKIAFLADKVLRQSSEIMSQEVPARLIEISHLADDEMVGDGTIPN